MKPDLAQLDWKFRAKRSGMSAVEYASSIQGFRRPRKHGPLILTAILLLGTLFMVRL